MSDVEDVVEPEGVRKDEVTKVTAPIATTEDCETMEDENGNEEEDDDNGTNSAPSEPPGGASGGVEFAGVTEILPDLPTDSDNLSMVVNVSSSRRASDVSNLSFPNFQTEGDDASEMDTENLDMDLENPDSVQSHQDSEESGDSCQPDDQDMEHDAQTDELDPDTAKRLSCHENEYLDKLEERVTESEKEREQYDSELTTSTTTSETDSSVRSIETCIDSSQLHGQSNHQATSSIDPGSGSEGEGNTKPQQDSDNTVSDEQSKGQAEGGDHQNALSESSHSSAVNHGRKSTEHAQSESLILKKEGSNLSENGSRSSSNRSSSEREKTPVTKRNSLEVRNNIPNVNEVKSYNMEDSAIKTLSQEMFPKMKKKSPGMAKRVGDGDVSDRETSSSEKELGSDKKVLTSSQNRGAQGNGKTTSDFERKKDVVPELLNSPQINGGKLQNINESEALASPNNGQGSVVANEYDYLKFARLQEGNSYVGMRLAYSSSGEFSVSQSQADSGLSRDSMDSSREGTPERVLHGHHSNRLATNNTAKLIEDNLTEIALNSDSSQTEGRNFTLSPETTECDSAEVESIASDDCRPTNEMPSVEDGLSSSQGSDAEDDRVPSAHNSPAHILKQRQKQEIDQLFGLGEYKDQGPMAANATCPMPQSKSFQLDEKPERPKSEVDLVLEDIQTAIKKSKSMTLKSPYSTVSEASDTEPVWVMRDSYLQKLQRQEEMRRVREKIEQEQEEALRRQEQEKVYEIEHEDERLMSSQLTRNDGKTYQAPKAYRNYDQYGGYASDDEYDEHDQDIAQSYFRRKSGKKYSSVPADDPTIDTAYVRSDLHVQNRYKQTMESSRPHYTTGKRTNSEYTTTATNKMLGHEIPTPQATISTVAKQRNCHRSNRSQGDDSDLGSDGGEDSPTHHAYIKEGGETDTDEETDQLLDKQYVKDAKVEIPELSEPPVNRSIQVERKSRSKEGEEDSSKSSGKDGNRQLEVSFYDPDEPTVLIEGVLFRARYLGSTQLISEGQPSKAMRMMQAQEAVGRIKTLGTMHFGKKFKAPEGESQPSTEVDLFVSTEKIMVLNTDLKEIMMDHALRTISYIADIEDIVVIMARRRMLTSPGDDALRKKKQTKILCHVFESDEAQLIAQSIGQAFHVAYMEFLKANGIDDPGLLKEMDYQDVLAQQEIHGEELDMFSNKENQKEVIVPKVKGEILGLVIVESGWGSMVPTVVIANMSPPGAAARCGQLNIGDQIISINGISLVGLPLSTCQNYIKAVKSQTVVKLTVVSCPPVVEVLIKRPDVKYQLGFSVQNGVICSLLRGGIAERGGVRVGHRIIEINGESVVAVPHEKIVGMLANSIGELHMKTMPTAIYRLLTGQETPHFI